MDPWQLAVPIGIAAYLGLLWPFAYNSYRESRHRRPARLAVAALVGAFWPVFLLAVAGAFAASRLGLRGGRTGPRQGQRPASTAANLRYRHAAD
jgi:hypothetical protein